VAQSCAKSKPKLQAGLARFGVSQLAGLVDLLAGDAQFGGSGWSNIVLLGNDVGALRSGRNLTPLLSRIIFIGQLALGLIKL
jgi:hypothetical protein